MSLMSTQAAHSEYVNRPKDERYPSVAALVNAAEAERALSAERDYNLKDLHVMSLGQSDNPKDRDLVLEGPKGRARFTHWAFGQFARMIGAPAQYLRELPASIAASAMNYGIGQTIPGTRASLLVKAPNGTPFPMVRACTSDSYARVWDSVLYGGVQRQIIDHDGQWTLPPTWTGEAAGP